jgi:hypothetical protein
MSRKTEVYTWRVSSAMKATLEKAARNANRSVAQLLDEIVAEHFSSTDGTSESEVEHQRRLHARATLPMDAGSLTSRNGRRFLMMKLDAGTPTSKGQRSNHVQGSICLLTFDL